MLAPPSADPSLSLRGKCHAALYSAGALVVNRTNSQRASKIPMLFSVVQDVYCLGSPSGPVYQI